MKITLYDQAPAPKGWPDYDGHGSPIPAYATGELYRWLFVQVQSRAEKAVEIELEATGLGTETTEDPDVVAERGKTALISGH